MLTIGFLVYEGVQPLDLVGPLDAFAAANVLNPAGPRYQLLSIGLTTAAIRAETPLTLSPDCSLADAPPLDTLLIPGGAGSRQFLQHVELLHWIRTRATNTRRIVSVCTGLYLLAATGLLDGRRATTHWRHAADVRARFPKIRLDTDQLYLRDGPFHSSGGLTAGMDLALALIEADLDAAVALSVARQLVMYMKRPGNQAQFSAPLDAQTRADGRFGALIDWLIAHLHESLSVERLADRAAMSPRNFRRLFQENFAQSSARYIERLRLERACAMLLGSTDTVERIAQSVGFASADGFRRAFRARFEASPLEYRQRFGA